MGLSRFLLGCMVPLVKVIENFQVKLGAIRGLWSDPWCIRGDFNSFCILRERIDASRLFMAIKRFSKVIEDLQLRDLPFLGGPFTWSGRLDNLT